jgi:hypothetical protein
MKLTIFLITMLCSSILFADDIEKQKAAKDLRAAKLEFSRSIRLSIAMEKAVNRRDRIENGRMIYIYVPYFYPVGPSYSLSSGGGGGNHHHNCGHRR